MTGLRLAVDPVRCTAHGLCAELLPERVVLDEWGYPVLDGRPLPQPLLADARRAARACPVLALSLTTDPGRTTARTPVSARPEERA